MNYEAARLLETMHSSRYVTGMTHNFYKYPARFSPELAHEVIHQFSQQGEWVFDPFMGGGTSIVESLALGRNALGIDINSLAWFVSTVKTTPLSEDEFERLNNWVIRLPEIVGTKVIEKNTTDIPNVSSDLVTTINALLASAGILNCPRLEQFVKCAILRTSQKLIDGRDVSVLPCDLVNDVSKEIDKMLVGLSEFMGKCESSTISDLDILSRRVLLHRSVIGIEYDSRLDEYSGKPRLVFTSPPYPGVHVLYHRWQISGRKETPLPYHICGLPDGNTEAYYTFGGRRTRGAVQYFNNINMAFSSIAKLIDKNAIVVQLMGFSNINHQLPSYLWSMENAGYEEIFPITNKGERIWREVPNRKWYTSIGDVLDSSQEVLMFHRLKI